MPKPSTKLSSLNRDGVKDLISSKALSRSDKLIICLAFSDKPLNTRDLKSQCHQFGMVGVKNWNVTDILRKSGYALHTALGWEIVAKGKERISELSPTKKPKAHLEISQKLRAHALKLKNKDTRAFLEEAIDSFEADHFRAAVVLSWVGAVAILQDQVVAGHLAAFNAAAIAKDSRWKNAVTADDLSRMKEFQFLDIIESLSIISKNVKQELQNCLKLRNGCGHPNSLKIGENRVAAHLEILILNVFSKF